MTRLTLVFLLVPLLTGCGDDAAPTPTGPVTVEGQVNNASRLFTGTLASRDAQFYSFTLRQDSGVFVTLASVTGTDRPDAIQVPLGIGLGVPRGTGCAVTTTLVTTAALTPQIRQWTAQGVRCVSVYDPGTLTSDVRFAIRIGYFQ